MFFVFSRTILVFLLKTHFLLFAHRFPLSATRHYFRFSKLDDRYSVTVSRSTPLASFRSLLDACYSQLTARCSVCLLLVPN